MPRTDNQRYMPTDVRSRIIRFLWSIGFMYEGPRGLMADRILAALKEQQCVYAKETSLLNGSREER